MKTNLKELKEKKTIKELLEFGILNIDKSSGPTSFDISDFVRKTLSLKKTSHFGTLDPKVTGVLPIALNRACKLTGFFIGEDKEYVGIMRIHEDLEIEKIREAITKNFKGIIKQTPPVKSRVKRQEREREIKVFEILEKEGQDILFRVVCQGGTYIRKLVHDLGIYLKCGAHMLELRRTRAGIFKEESDLENPGPMINLYDFERIVKDFQKDPKENEAALKEIIIPGEIISELYPIVQIKDEYVEKILHGSPIHYSHLINPEDKKNDWRFCAFNKEKFMGIYEVTSEGEIFARPQFVLQPIES
ncbi:RNA-guided pseudouridylation complex pseudouridine synthase subunit Cbf5 [Patescibacteria group bacterium]|nr:RNA-guided pseudouridylation complex pseudouridine synthase subunit Cbf5 [Patescibacteria group bacterium]